MTLEQLMDCSWEELKAMSDEQLLAHFKQYLPVTRPELAPRPVKKDSFDPQSVARKQKLAKLAELGFDVSLLSPKQKKKL